jgi:hypothetical protein
VITRLREKYTDEELKQVYATPHDSSRWEDHNIRVAETIRIAKEQVPWHPNSTIADLSCGDARIARGLGLPDSHLFLGDFAAGYQFQGPVEQTIEQIPEVSAYILSETLEHLDDPLTALRKIRTKTDYIIVTTPHAKWDDNNPEHYWAWDGEGVISLLAEAGFLSKHFEILPLAHYYYDFQVIVAK